MTAQDSRYRLTILGCGSSGGVPRIGNNWGACDPENPKNRRRRCSLLVQRFDGDDVTSILVDTSPDARQQLLDTGVGWLDGVIITHEHADHTHGIDELRVVAINGRSRVHVHADTKTGNILKDRFGYCFVQPEGSSYPPILNLHTITAFEPFEINGPGGPIRFLPFDQVHGDITALGLKIGRIAYSSDLSDLPEVSLPILSDLEVWIVDALRHAPHPSHFSVSDALYWIERLAPEKAILTNLHTDLDYDALNELTPEHVVPAHDMMAIEFDVEDV